MSKYQSHDLLLDKINKRKNDFVESKINIKYYLYKLLKKNNTTPILIKRNTNIMQLKKSKNIYRSKAKPKPIPPKPIPPISPFPLVYSLNSYRNFVYDQGQLGSCTANAFAASYRILAAAQNKDINFLPSRLYFYYHERLIEGNVSTDAGADIIDGEQYVYSRGICSETSWPYDISQFAVPPSSICDIEATNHKIAAYQTIPINSNLLNNIRKVICNKQPVQIAISVYDSFESDYVATSGLVPIPNFRKENYLGGHELCLIGYNDNKQLFTVLNSWGTDWGDNGLCYFPYAYLLNPKLGLEFTVFYL
jgi:C1A family cysteine protease